MTSSTGEVITYRFGSFDLPLENVADPVDSLAFHGLTTAEPLAAAPPAAECLEIDEPREESPPNAVDDDSHDAEGPAIEPVTTAGPEPAVEPAAPAVKVPAAPLSYADKARLAERAAFVPPLPRTATGTRDGTVARRPSNGGGRPARLPSDQAADGERQPVAGVAETAPQAEGSNGAGTNVGAPSHVLVLCTRTPVAGAAGSPPLSLAPRGLVNTGNSCFVNAPLQALLACGPFLHLMADALADFHAQRLPPACRTLRAFAQFTESLSHPPPPGPQPALLPDMFGDVLEAFRPTPAERPPTAEGASSTGAWSPARPLRLKTARVRKQEDAQEFLSFLLDSLHQELLILDARPATDTITAEVATAPAAEPPAVVSPAAEWSEVGARKNQTKAVMREHQQLSSRMSDIFGGQLRSEVRCAKAKPSVTVEPFMLLSVPLADGHEAKEHAARPLRVEDALARMVAPEALHGYVSRGAAVAATKHVRLQRPPRMLLLHLMRFSHGPHGMYKLGRPVIVPRDLPLAADLLAGPAATPLMYTLCATVTHHGRGPSDGHYTADAKQGGRWLRYDDARVGPVRECEVLHDQAYLLLYEKVDVRSF